MDRAIKKQAKKYCRSADEKTVRILNGCLEIIAKEPFIIQT